MKLLAILEEGISKAELTEAKNSSGAKLKPWATELAAIIARAHPNTDFGVAGMGGEGETISKAEMKKIVAEFKKEGYTVRKGQHGYKGDFIDSKTDPKKAVGFSIDPWEEGDDNVIGMYWAD